MKAIVDKNKIVLVQEDILHKGESNVNEIEMTFSDEYNGFTKKAVFTNSDNSYEVIVSEDKCKIPAEVLIRKDEIVLFGVYAYNIVDGLLVRYSPEPLGLEIKDGSYVNAVASEEITPTQFEQYQKQLNDGLEKLQNSVDEFNEKILNNDFKGEKGDPFTYEDFTPEQLEALRGPKGDKGDAGPKGEDGQNGKDGQNGTNGLDGKDGITPNIKVGEVSTLPAGSNVTVTQSGTVENPVLNFGIPKGDKGDSGEIKSVGVYAIEASSENPAIMSDLDVGVYIINNQKNKFYYRVNKDASRYSLSNGNIVGRMIYIFKRYDECIDNELFGITFTSTDVGEYYTSAKLTTMTKNELLNMINAYSEEIPYGIVTTDDNQGINGVKTFYNLPKCEEVPTTETQLVNKKYVDEAIAQAISSLNN